MKEHLPVERLSDFYGIPEAISRVPSPFLATSGPSLGDGGEKRGAGGRIETGKKELN